MRNKYLKLAAVAAALLPISEVGAQNMNNWYKTVTNGGWDTYNTTWNKWRNASGGYIQNGTGPGKGIPRSEVFHNIVLASRQDNGIYSMDKTIIHTNASIKSNAGNPGLSGWGQPTGGQDDTIRLVRWYGNANQLATTPPPLDTSLYVEDGASFGGAGKAGWIVLQSMQGDVLHSPTNVGIPRALNVIDGPGLIQVAGLSIGSVTSGFTDSVIINSNVTVTGDNNVGSAYGFTAYNNSTSNHKTDLFTMIINAGKTVTLIDSAYFHMSSDTTANASGTINYFINGTLDATGSVGKTNVTASPVTSTAVTTITVNGLYKMGNLFNTMTRASAADSGKLTMIINPGGVVDASLVATPNANFGAKQWFTNGTGILKRVVGATDTMFALTGAANTNNSVLLRTAAKDTFSVSVGAANYTWPMGSVNKEWKIKKTATGDAKLTASFMFTSVDLPTGFTLSATPSVYVYNGVQWKEYPATLTGAGTMASPYKVVTNDTIGSVQVAYVAEKAAGVPNPVGIKNVNVSNDVTIAPNPVVNGSFSLQMKNVATGRYAISLYNIIGQKVYSTELNHVSGTGAYQVNIPSTLTSGIYQLTINGNGVTATQKLMVK